MATTLALAALSFGIQALSNKLLGPDDDALLQDERPTSLSTQGTPLPLLIGRRRLGHVFLGAWNRTSEEEGSKGKGAPGGGGQVVWYEEGWHGICVGPAARMYRIKRGGKNILTGSLDPVSLPSGSTLDLGKEGILEMYWGQSDQPISSFLSNANRVGVASRWPFVCSIVWRPKRLGPLPQWPLLDYEMEIRPYGTILTRSRSWIDGALSLSGTPRNVIAAVNGGPGVAKVRVDGDRTREFQPGGYAELTGVGAAPDGRYRIFSVTYNPGIWPTEVNETTITFGQPLAGATGTGTVEAYEEDKEGGANGAHIISQLLLEEHPHGLGLDPDLIDIESLEELGVLIEQEELVMNMSAKDAGEATKMLGTIIQDLGVMTPIVDGKLRFVPVRDPSEWGGITTVPEEMVLDPRPEMEQVHGRPPNTKIVYLYDNVRRSFRKSPVMIWDDGQSTRRYGGVNTANVSLVTVTTRKSASRVAERRFQEDSPMNVKSAVDMNRGARRLFPGVAITCPTISSGRVQRVIGIGSPDAESGRTRVDLLEDSYGVDTVEFENEEPGGDPGEALPQLDEQSRIVEVPAPLIAQGAGQFLMVPRIRNHAGISSADIHLSVDDVTYKNVGTETAIQRGGLLTSVLAADAGWNLAEGPTFDAVGPDIAGVLDLTGDNANWRAGRQLAIINGEVFYLKKITSLGGASYRLDGLIRARYDTAREAHAIGDEVYIVLDDGIFSFQDSLLAPDVQVFTKVQPFAGGSTIGLGAIFPRESTLYGKNVRPMPLANLHNATNFALVHKQLAPGDLTYRWQYRSNLSPTGTGAGLQNAGAPTGFSLPEGQFIIRFKTTGNVLKREVTGLTTNEYVYTQAFYFVDFPGLSDYRVTVQYVNGGYSTDELLVTSVVIP